MRDHDSALDEGIQMVAILGDLLVPEFALLRVDFHETERVHPQTENPLFNSVLNH